MHTLPLSHIYIRCIYIYMSDFLDFFLVTVWTSAKPVLVSAGRGGEYLCTHCGQFCSDLFPWDLADVPVWFQQNLKQKSSSHDHINSKITKHIFLSFSSWFLFLFFSSGFKFLNKIYHHFLSSPISSTPRPLPWLSKPNNI